MKKRFQSNTVSTIVIITTIAILSFTGCTFHIGTRNSSQPSQNWGSPSSSSNPEQLNDPKCEQLAINIDSIHNTVLKEDFSKALSENYQLLVFVNSSLRNEPPSPTASPETGSMPDEDKPLPPNTARYQGLYNIVLKSQHLFLTGFAYNSPDTPQEYKTTQNMMTLTTNIKKHYIYTEKIYQVLCGKYTPGYMLNEHPTNTPSNTN